MGVRHVRIHVCDGMAGQSMGWDGMGWDAWDGCVHAFTIYVICVCD